LTRRELYRIIKYLTNNYIPFRMKLFTRFCFLATFIFFGLTSQAQATATSNIPGAYVKSTDLNVDRYVEFAKAMNIAGAFVIDSACIPAHLMHIQTTDGQTPTSAQWQEVKALAQSHGIGDLQILENYSAELFMEACSAKRNK
jgi:hypothetical protein